MTPSTFFVYVAGGFARKPETVKDNLIQCSSMYGRPVSAITIDALLDLMEMENLPKPADLIKAFKQCCYYTSGVSLLDSISLL